MTRQWFNNTLTKHRFTPVLLLFVLVSCGPQTPKAHDNTFDGQIMGTFYQVRVVTDTPLSDPLLGDALLAVMEDTNQRMSNWIAESEISRFNAHQSPDPFPISEQTAAVIQTALMVSEKSNGALDPTIGPLIELWGFGKQGKTVFPSDEALQAIEGLYGIDKLSLDGLNLVKTAPELALNLSANAKGFAVDQVANHLDDAGYTNYMVNIGGEVRVRGNSSKGAPWRMAIEKPKYDGGQEIYKVYNLGNKALATSGDYRIFFEHEGKRYSHIIDPRNGRPVTHDIASASVIADTCDLADALATTLLVLPPDEGIALVESMPGVECLIMIRNDDLEEGFTTKVSSGMNAFEAAKKP